MHSLPTPTIAVMAATLVALALSACPAITGPSGATRLAFATEKKTQQQTTEQNPSAVTGSLPVPKKELMAGGVRARLTLSGAGVRFSAGTPAFAEIILTNVAGPKLARAEVVLETDLAQIRDITGKNVKSEDRDGGRVAVVDGLRKGRSRKLTVELQLTAGAGGEPRDNVNRLRITLRPPGENGDRSDSTVVAWPVADCASDFYARIVAIRELNSDRMGKALKSAWRRDRERPGRWLFRPPASRSAKRACQRWRRVWDARRGRYRSRCTRYSAVGASAAPGAKVTKAERDLFRFAAKYVRSRAADPLLSPKQHYGWISQKVATDLRGYLKQTKHPAICTGAIGFVSYYGERMAEIGKKADMFEEHLKQARKLAIAKVAAARNEVKAEPGGHPGWGAEPLSLLEPDESRTSQELVADLAELGGDRASVADIAQAPSAYAALKDVRAMVSQESFKSLSRPTRGMILHALSLIEAADYIAAVGERYAGLDRSIIGSLEAVKKAHARHCTCTD